jgi:hypothetical protein
MGSREWGGTDEALRMAFPTPDSPFPTPFLRQVESRGVLAYSNCAFEAVPTPLLP